MSAISRSQEKYLSNEELSNKCAAKDNSMKLSEHY